MKILKQKPILLLFSLTALTLISLLALSLFLIGCNKKIDVYYQTPPAIIIQMTSDPSEYEFSALYIGQTSTKRFTIENSGNVAQTNCSTPTISGDNVFLLNTSCTDELAVGATCNIDISFQPIITGTYSTTIQYICAEETVEVAVTADGVSTGISNVTINGGASVTTEDTITVAFTIDGTADGVCITELSIDFCSWNPDVSSPKTYTFLTNSSDATKDVHVWSKYLVFISSEVIESIFHDVP